MDSIRTWFSGMSNLPTQSLGHAPLPAHPQGRRSRSRTNATQSAPVTPPNGPLHPAMSFIQPTASKPTVSNPCKRQFSKSRSELLRTPNHIPHDIEAKTQALMTEVTRNFFDPLPAAHKSKIYEVVETSTRHAQQNVDLKMAVVEREDYILALHEGLDAEVQAKEAHNDQLQEELSQVKAELALVKAPPRSSECHGQYHEASEPSASLLIERIESSDSSVSAPASRPSPAPTFEIIHISSATQTEISSQDAEPPVHPRPALSRRFTDTALLCVESKEDLDAVSPFARLLSDRSGILYDEVLEKIVAITAKSFSPPRVEHIEVVSPVASPLVNVEQRASAARSPSPQKRSLQARSSEDNCSTSVIQGSQQKTRTRRASNAKTTAFPRGNIRTKAGERRVTLPKRTRHRNTRGSIDEGSPSASIFPEPALAE